MPMVIKVENEQGCFRLMSAVLLEAVHPRCNEKYGGGLDGCNAKQLRARAENLEKVSKTPIIDHIASANGIELVAVEERIKKQIRRWRRKAQRLERQTSGRRMGQ